MGQRLRPLANDCRRAEPPPHVSIASNVASLIYVNFADYTKFTDWGADKDDIDRRLWTWGGLGSKSGDRVGGIGN